MNGQWLGRYTGTNSGTLMIDLDDKGTHYEGRACAYDDNTALPSTFVIVKTENKATQFQLRLQLYPLDPRTGDATTWNQLGSVFPNVTFPVFADVIFDLQGHIPSINWRTNIETTGSAQLQRSRAGDPTEYQPLPNVTNWVEFKTFVSTLDHRQYIFRGQEQPIRLRTSFHRTGRADLSRF